MRINVLITNTHCTQLIMHMCGVDIRDYADSINILRGLESLMGHKRKRSTMFDWVKFCRQDK